VQTLLIVDGHAYAYRAFHAIRSLRSPSGRPTNAIYGFVKMLEKIRQAILPEYVTVVWDGGMDAGRMAMLPEYKVHRPEMPGDLRVQLDEIVKYLRAAGLGSECRDGIEADDLIASLAISGAAAGLRVVIASSDKDFMQLVSAQVGLLNPGDKTGAIWTAEHVLAKAEVEPGQVVDWLALTGDAVDNISGVPGVGAKTAAKLLKQFGSISVLYNRLAEVSSDKLRESLSKSAEIVRRNVQMVQLKMDLPVNNMLAEALVKLPDGPRLRELYQQWGFKGLLASLPEPLRENQTILL
jgi:DNA polymerase-1